MYREAKEYVARKITRTLTREETGTFECGTYSVKLTDEEIVRCRDCKHFREARDADGNSTRKCTGHFAWVVPNPDGYCAWGERS